MGIQHAQWPDRAFWDGYLAVLGAAGIKPEKAKWYVHRVERYLKVHPNLAVSDHEADHVHRWFERKRREADVTGWQLMQMVDALGFAFRDLLRAPWAAGFDWDGWRQVAHSLARR